MPRDERIVFIIVHLYQTFICYCFLRFCLFVGWFISLFVCCCFFVFFFLLFFAFVCLFVVVLFCFVFSFFAHGPIRCSLVSY